MMIQRQPIIEEIGLSRPAVECFEVFANRPYSFFLDSGMDPEKLGRYSFMGSDPFLILRSRGDDVSVIKDGDEVIQQGNPFDILGDYLDAYRLDRGTLPVPFTGGAVGYFSYDLGRFIEKLPSTATDDLQLPEMYLCFYDVIVAFDHAAGTSYLISSGFPENVESLRVLRARWRIDEVKTLLEQSYNTLPEKTLEAIPSKLHGNFTHKDYLEAVARAREYICAGDIFQVNLSQRFDISLSVTPWELYKRLRTINPAPFANYFSFEGVAVVGASPERYMKLNGDRVKTRPIKGTKPRGKNSEEDRALAESLLNSRKDRAENIMIVDLERNDIGRVCRYGSVKVTELAILETYPTVFHLTSTVVGQLQEGKRIIDLLKATFPGGSITGAPKVRAMEIIEELEPTRRSVYTGSLGYIGFNGDLDLDIVIRTILVKDGRAYFQVGGAIVYDSEPESEYIETLDKGRALLRALGLGDESVEA